MGSGDIVYIQSFLKIGTAVQAIIRFCHSNLKSCNVGIPDGGGFMIYTVEMGLDTKFLKDWYSHSEVNREHEYTDT
jgi:hypothetical protein